MPYFPRSMWYELEIAVTTDPNRRLYLSILAAKQQQAERIRVAYGALMLVLGGIVILC